MKRRAFIAGLGTAAAWPLSSRAQRSTMPVIGFLNGGSPDAFQDRLAGIHDGQSEAGYFEGRNIALEYRWAEGNYDRLPGLVADLVRRGVAAISATGGDVVALAAKRGTSTTPIAFVVGGDPVDIGLVASFSRPGGNVTGISLVSAALGAKRLELVHELVPDATSIAVLTNPASPSSVADRRSVQEAAGATGQRLNVATASTDEELDAAFLRLGQQKVAALVVSTDAFFNTRRRQLIALARQHGIPTIYYERVFALDGGLVSYGTSIVDAYRHCGISIGKILHGTKPGDLPVEQPTKFELVINLKTAEALGLTVPPTLIARADEVIE
jgi:putative ABC transport system substrate-binding protein